MIKVKNINDVVEWQLCTGCGMCAAAEPARFTMVDVPDYGLRPKTLPAAPPESGQAFKHCPGHSLKHHFDPNDQDLNKELLPGWGPVYGVWEGFASDDEVRFRGSSGGAATALALFGIEKGRAKQVLHVSSKTDTPYLNESVFSSNKNELMEREGSRYAPASPCEKLSQLKSESSATVFIGKPCDVAAAASWEHDAAENELAIKIGFFCAGVPSTAGNLALIERQQIDKDELSSLKYRGQGWPGLWQAKEKSGKSSELTYASSWGFLQSFRQWRCYICPDHTAEFADIAVGDPWYREIQEGEPGSSLIVARTRKGLAYLKDAEKNGYITLKQERADLLPRSQPNLMRTRGMLWARLKVLFVFRGAVPDFSEFDLFRFWWSELPPKEKIQSFTGTIKRVFRKSLNKRVQVVKN